MSNPIPRLVVIVGETASGKSALATAIAQKFDGEIISADSWQVYKGFNIGTAKPTPTEMTKIPHHLLDVVDASQGFSAAIYKRLALRAINDVFNRHKLPILVGGTGLYIDAVVFDYGFLPAGTPSLRKELNKLTTPQLLALANQQGLDTLGIDTQNKRRLVRLIETKGAVPKRSDKLRPNTLVLGVKLSRSELRRRITQRVETMFRTGLKHEVRELADKYGWDNEAMKGIGYRELRGYFEGEFSNSQLKQKIVKSTLDLAKRQRTWFKRNRQIVWIENHTEAIKLVKKFVGK